MKEINKEQIVQLREHDLNRGHNKSQTPIYPKTVVEAVEGLEDVSGVTVVEELPESPEPGKIYYNTTDGYYYIVDDSGETPKCVAIGNQDIPVVSLSTPASNNYQLEANKYYLLGTINIIDNPVPTLLEPTLSPKITLTEFTMDGIAKQYFGRFTAGADSLNISFGTDLVGNPVYVPDQDKEVEIVEGHTYEFNVLYNTVFIKDITYTSDVTPVG